MKRTFGRSHECDIVLKDAPKDVSRKHGVLIEENGCVSIRDTSSNGSYVDGHDIHDEVVPLNIDSEVILSKNYVFDWQKYVDISDQEDGTLRFNSRRRSVPPLVKVPSAIEINQNNAEVYRNGDKGADWKVPFKRNMGDRIGNAVGSTLGCLFSLIIAVLVIVLIVSLAGGF